MKMFAHSVVKLILLDLQDVLSAETQSKLDKFDVVVAVYRCKSIVPSVVNPLSSGITAKTVTNL
jgi:hypothetical protein